MKQDEFSHSEIIYKDEITIKQYKHIFLNRIYKVKTI